MWSWHHWSDDFCCWGSFICCSVLIPILPSKGWTVGWGTWSWPDTHVRTKMRCKWTEKWVNKTPVGAFPPYFAVICAQREPCWTINPACDHTHTCSLNMRAIARVDDYIFSFCKGVLLTLPLRAQAIKSNRADLVSVQSVLRNKKHDPDSMLYFTLSSNSVEID